MVSWPLLLHLFMGCYDMFRILLILPLLPAARLLRHIAWSCCFLHHFLFASFIFSPHMECCLSRWLPRPFETCVDHVNTSMLGVTPCRALLLTLLRSATGCHSGVTFPIFSSTGSWGLVFFASRLRPSFGIFHLFLLHPARGGVPGVTFSQFLLLLLHFFTMVG